MDESLEIIQDNHLWSKPRFKLRTVGAEYPGSGGSLSGPEMEHGVGICSAQNPTIWKMASAKESSTGFLRILFFCNCKILQPETLLRWGRAKL